MNRAEWTIHPTICLHPYIVLGIVACLNLLTMALVGFIPFGCTITLGIQIVVDEIDTCPS